VPKFFWDWLWWYNIANEKYNEGIRWKKELHKENKTTLISTYSYENHKWELFKKLENNLKNKWVEFKKLNKEDIKEKNNSFYKIRVLKFYGFNFYISMII